MLTSFLYIIFLVIGIAIAHFYHVSAGAKLLKEKQGTIDALNQTQTELRAENEKLKSDLQNARVHHAQLETKMTGLNEAINAYKESMRTEFRVLAGEVLEMKSKNLTEANQKEISTLLDPLKNELKEFKSKVETTYTQEAKERFALGKQIESLVLASGKVGQQADNLANALKTNVKLQGNWGEMLLESILEHSGLTKGREYFVQEYIRDNAGNILKDENGNGLQPDVTIIYPDQRKVIIDSKVSLIAWEQYINEPDPEKQKPLLDAHVRSVKQHVDGLAKKNYAKYAKALDYVIMFVPIEPAFLEALKQDTGLWKYAYDKQILIVAPTNLLAVLKIVSDLWKIEQQSKNAIDIAEKAGDLYDKFHGFISSMEEISDGLNKARTSYDKAFGQLSSGRGNLVGRVEELKKMGAKAKKSLPDQYLRDEE